MDRLILFLGLSLSLSSVILGSLANTATCPGFESQGTSSNKRPPLINHFKSFSHKNHDKTNFNRTDEDPDTIYIYRVTTKAGLNCWAPYPIDLTFKGLLTNLNAEVKTSVASFKSSNGSKVYCYVINVTLGIIDDSIVGNYSCFEASNPKNRASKYIYVISNPKTVLLRRGSKANTTVAKVLWRGQKHITFECAVSDPNVTVNLSKVESNGDIKDLTDEATYNPKTGFTLKISDGSKNPEGEYICRTPLDPSDIVRFNVTHASKINYHPRSGSIRRKVSGSLNLSCSYSDAPVFLSVDSNLMKLNPLILNSSRDEYTTTLWVANLSQPAEYSVSCRSTGDTEVKKWTITVDETKTVQFKVGNTSFTNRGKPFGFLDLNGFNEECIKDPRKRLILFECNNWVECRMNQCQDEPSKDRYCQSNNRCSKPGCMQNGLIQCATESHKDRETTISSVIFFHGITTKTEYSDASDLLESWKHDVLNLTVSVDPESPLSKMPTDPKIRLTCLGTNFVVSSGFEWFIIGENGSSYELTNSMGAQATEEELGFNYTISESYGKTKSSLRSDLLLPKKVLLSHPHLLSFQCKAPIWNSTNWVVNSISSKDILVSAQLLEETQRKKVPTSVKSVSNGKPTAEGFLVALLLTTAVLPMMHLFM